MKDVHRADQGDISAARAHGHEVSKRLWKHEAQRQQEAMRPFSSRRTGHNRRIRLTHALMRSENRRTGALTVVATARDYCLCRLSGVHAPMCMTDATVGG